MKTTFNILARRFLGFFGLIILLFISPAMAQNGVSLSANVLSGVSEGISTFVSDVVQLPADGKSVVILTATILSKEGEALPNKEVIVSSNRGDVDTVLCYSGSTLDDKPTVTFTPLPFLTNLTIKVNLPGGGKLTILEPVTPKPSKPANERLVNTDVELQIPFWVVVVIILFFLTEPILIILVLRLSRKVRRGFEAEKMALAKEQELLAKIYLLESQVVQTASDIEREVRQIESPASPQTIPVPPPLPQSPDPGQNPPTQ